MHTIGEYLRILRKNKGLTIESVEKGTKIKKEFIQNIEDEKWDRLPEYPVVCGFVKNISAFLGEDPKKAVALLRRDYPPKSLNVNPKPDISDKFVWSPKITFFFGAFIVIAFIIGYLIFQYIDFVSPPKLEISSPPENQMVSDKILMVAGKTDPDATIFVNGQSVIVDRDGKFSEDIEVSENVEKIVINAKSRSGKETTVERSIVVKFDN